jgi:hypothetical protein
MGFSHSAPRSGLVRGSSLRSSRGGGVILCDISRVLRSLRHGRFQLSLFAPPALHPRLGFL